MNNLRHFHQSLTRMMACSIAAALILSSSHIAEAAPAMTPDALERFAPAHGLGHLTDLYHGSSDRTVVLIQDLHVNFEAQKHISDILSQYSKEALLPTFVAVEGAEGTVNASVLADFPDAEVRRQSADYFMKKGEISGSASFAVTAGLPNLLYGVERGDYYEFHKALFRKSLGARHSLQQELTRLEKPLATLKRKEYSAVMRRLDRDNARFSQGKILAYDYRRNLENLRSLAQTPLQKNLVVADRTLTLLKRLLRQQVAEDEVKEAAAHLEQSLQILASVLDLDDKSLARVADAVKASIEFYVLAAMREKPMFENTLARMDAMKTPVGILVAGGFHTRGLTALLKSQGISYVVITPDVKKINSEDEKLYEERLMGRHVTVAEVLSDRSSSASSARAVMLSTGFTFLQDSALWAPIRTFQETRMYGKLVAKGMPDEEAIQTVAASLALKSRSAASIRAGLAAYSYGIHQALAEEAEYFLDTNPVHILRFIFAHGLNPLAVLARGVGYAYIIAYAAVQTLLSPAANPTGKGGTAQVQMSAGRLFLHYTMAAHRGWNAGPGIMRLARLALPSPADNLVRKVEELSRVPGGIVAGVGLKDSYGRVFSPDGRFFTPDGKFTNDLRNFMVSLSHTSVREMVKAGIMYYDIRSGFWRQHPEFTVAFALAFAKKIQEKTKKKEGIVIHLAVDAYPHHFEAAQIFADAILRTGITDKGGGIYYWGVRNGGSIRNYAQLYEATHHMGGDWVFFTQSHRTENDISGAKLGIDGEVFCGPQIRHVGSVTRGTLFDGIVDVRDGQVPVTRRNPDGVVVNVADTSRNDVKVAADLIRATSAIGRGDIPDNELLAGAKLFMPVDGRSISMDAVKLLRALGADVAVNSEAVDPQVSPNFVRDPNEHHKPEVLAINERVDEFAAAGERRIGAFVDPDGDRAGFSSKVGDAPAVTMPGSELVQLVVAGLASTGQPVTAISDMRTGVGTKDLEKALVAAGQRVRVVPFEAGYAFFMAGMAELPADVAIENTLHFFMNPMTNTMWGAPQNLKRLDGSKGYQGGDDASLAIAYIVGAMVHQWEGRNPLEQLRWLQQQYNLKPTVTGEKKPALSRENDIEKYDIAERMKVLAAAWFGGDSQFQINFNNPEVEVVSGVHLVNNETGAMVLTRYSNSGPGFTISGEAYRGSEGHENDQLNEMLGLGYLLMAVAVEQLQKEGHQFAFDWKDAASLAGAFDPAKYGLPPFQALVTAGTKKPAPPGNAAMSLRIGGTMVEGALVFADGGRIERFTLDWDQIAGMLGTSRGEAMEKMAPQTVELLARQFGDLLQRHGVKPGQLTEFGLSVAGPIYGDKVYLTNLPVILKGLNLGQEILNAIGGEFSAVPNTIRNDTQAGPQAMMPMKSTRAFVDWLMRLLHLENGWVRAILETGVAEINPAEDLGVALMTPEQYGASHRNPDLAKAGQKITRTAMIVTAVAVAAFAGQHGYELAATLKLLLLAIVLAEKVFHLALNVLKLIGDAISRRRDAKNAEAARVNRLAQAILGIGRQIHLGELVTFASVFMVSLALSFHFGGHDQESARRAAERFGYGAFATAA